MISGQNLQANMLNTSIQELSALRHLVLKFASLGPGFSGVMFGIWSIEKNMKVLLREIRLFGQSLGMQVERPALVRLGFRRFDRFDQNQLSEGCLCIENSSEIARFTTTIPILYTYAHMSHQNSLYPTLSHLTKYYMVDRFRIRMMAYHGL